MNNRKIGTNKVQLTVTKSFTHRFVLFPLEENMDVEANWSLFSII